MNGYLLNSLKTLFNVRSHDTFRFLEMHTYSVILRELALSLFEITRASVSIIFQKILDAV